MKRKLFTFLVAFLATLSGAVWGQTTINLSTSSVSGSGASIEEDSPFGPTIEIKASGKYNITGETNKYQVWIEQNVGEVEITLSDVTINLGDERSTYRPIHIQSGNTVTLIIKGTNTVSTGNKEAGITVRMGSSLKIQGTGILRAEGWLGIGDADNTCGNIEIFSGTVVARGTTYCIGCSGPVLPMEQKPTLDMTGDALLVVYDESDNRSRGIFNMKYWGSEFEDPNDPRNHPNKGIYCNAKAQADFGSLYSDVTLQSPFPSDDFVINLNNHALTLSKGSYARKNQITGNGTLYAYDVTYDLNKKLGNNELSIADETPYTSIYCGPGVDLAVLPTATNSGPSWQCLGWTSDKTSYKAASVPANDIPDTPVTNPANQITATAVWAVAEWTTVNVNVGQMLNTEIPLIYPTSLTGVMIEEQVSGILDTYGAKLDGTKIVAGDNPAGSENDAPENVTLNVTNFEGNKTIMIPFKVNNTAPDLGDEDVTKVTVTSSLSYTGKEVDVAKLITRVTVNGKAVGINQFDVKYSSDTDGKNEISAPTNVGDYYVFIAAKDGSTSYQGESKPQKFSITAVMASVKTNNKTITNPTSSTVSFESDDLTVTPLEQDELTVAFATISPKTIGADLTKAGIYNIQYTDITFKGAAKDNYTAPASVDGQLTVKIDGSTNPINPNPDDGDDPIIKPNDSGWTGNDNGWTRAYDGENHRFTAISVTYTDETTPEGTKTEVLSIDKKDVTVTYSTDDAGQNVVNEIKNQGTYYAHITITKANFVYSGEVQPIKLVITARPMVVTFSVPNHIESTDPITITDEYVNYEAQNGNRGLVTNEVPKIESGEFVFEESSIEGKYKVILHDFVLSSSNTFNPDNYKLQIWDATQGKYVEYDNTGEDIIIIDPENPENNPNTPGEGVVVGTDDDSNDEGDGDGDSDIKLFRIYTDEVCAGVELEYSREVVKGGQSTIVTVNVEKGYDASALKLSFKRGLYGDWEPLTLNKDGQYQIKNIWKDISVRAEGVVTGMEDIDGAARVYAKDGSLYIYTPQQDDITVVSMTGAVVKRTKQIGLQSYPLNQGIYVVRVGEQVFKIRVK